MNSAMVNIIAKHKYRVIRCDRRILTGLLFSTAEDFRRSIGFSESLDSVLLVEFVMGESSVSYSSDSSNESLP